MSTTQEANLAAALALARAGLKVFPANADKRPLFTRWQEIATADVDVVADWGRRAPYALPALPAGENGFVVLDLDRHPGGADGIQAFKQLVELHGGLPPCPMVRTPNGGLHLYFRQPDGEPFGNSRGTLPDGVDVRGIGGYVIAPGAMLPDGRGWIAVKGKPPIGRETAATLPGWLQQFIRRTNGADPDGGDAADASAADEPTEATSDKRGRAYALRALQEIEDELAATQPGERNERLYKSAFRLGTMMARGWLDESEVTAALTRAADDNRYTREHGSAATRRTIRSGLDDGCKVPHEDLEDRAEYQTRSDHQEEVRQGKGGSQGTPQQEQQQRRRHRQQQQQTGDWDEPDTTILDTVRGDLPEFLCDTLGADWSEWLDRSRRGAGVTPAHVAVPTLGTASGIIGTARRVQAARPWSEPATLWTAIIGYSSTGKTPGSDVVLRALSMIETNRRSHIEALQRGHETKVEIAKAEKKKWERAVHEAVEAGGPPPPKPAAAREPDKFIVPRLFASNVTIERWAALLQARPSGLLMFRDELSGLFLNMSRYTNGQDNEFWLEAYNGKYYVVERQSAPAIVIRHLLIGMTGGFQPDKLARSFKGDDDGMYGRICFAWPPNAPYHKLTDEVAEMEPELINALNRLANLPCTDAEGKFAPRTVPLSIAARDEFEQFRQFVHEEQEQLYGREREWWGKGPAHVLRLALTLAYMDWAWAGGLEPKEIAAQYIKRAVMLWRDYFWPHARAALRQMGFSDKHSDARRALLWMRAGKRTEISLKDLRRDALGQRLDAEQTQIVIEYLIAGGWLREITQKPGPLGGRAARRWEVNPKLFSVSNAGTAGTAETSPSG
jgi:Protein of unknown function (DUF3987)/Bifunctional DNA primase/polymerase, N-terminal